MHTPEKLAPPSRHQDETHAVWARPMTVSEAQIRRRAVRRRATRLTSRRQLTPKSLAVDAAVVSEPESSDRSSRFFGISGADMRRITAWRDAQVLSLKISMDNLLRCHCRRLDSIGVALTGNRWPVTPRPCTSDAAEGRASSFRITTLDSNGQFGRRLTLPAPAAVAPFAGPCCYHGWADHRGRFFRPFRLQSLARRHCHISAVSCAGRNGGCRT